MIRLMTIGYEAASPVDFDRALLDRDVDLLVDVRAVAMSRRRGFSKTALAARIKVHGIDYLHLRDLGDPKPGREAARAGRWVEFETIYGAHLQTVDAVEALDELVRLARTRRVALMCYEADASTCHRTIIAERVVKHTRQRIDHLLVSADTGWGNGGTRTGHHFGESRAAP